MSHLPASRSKAISLLSPVGALVVAATLLLTLSGRAAAADDDANNPCGSLDTHYGPFDYRTDRARLPIVEKYHFTAAIERLQVDQNGSDTGGHLIYTLHAFPNHPRALYALVRFSEKMKSRKPPGVDYTVDCYFERAIRFRNDDYIVRLLFASFLGKTDRKAAALEQVNYVKTLVEPDNPLAQQNIGMVLFELGRFDDALAQAHRVIRMGVPKSELKDKLVAAGRWKEPAAEAAAAPASAAAQ